jgi:hypothetical protein
MTKRLPRLKEDLLKVILVWPLGFRTSASKDLRAFLVILG